VIQFRGRVHAFAPIGRGVAPLVVERERQSRAERRWCGLYDSIHSVLNDLLSLQTSRSFRQTRGDAFVRPASAPHGHQPRTSTPAE
jgi:hypothetical protein